MNRPDHRSPWVLDAQDLTRRPGTMKELTRTVVLPEDFGSDIIAIRAGSPVEIEVRLESVVEGVLVTGSVSGRATGACVRCLDLVEMDVSGRFQELFAYADRVAHHHKAGDDLDEDDVYEIEDDEINLETVLRDAVVPAMPFQPVCRQDCPGLCSECGARLADDPDHHHEVIDPRWSALSGLLGQDTQEKRN